MSTFEIMAVLVAGVLLALGLGMILVRALRGWRMRRIAGDLRRFYFKTRAAHEKLRMGLQALAGIVPQLEDPRLLLSRRGVELLDRHAVSTMQVERALGAVYGRSRFRRLAVRQLEDLGGLDKAFQRFQHAVLLSLYQQAMARVVMPPLAVRRYRAAFRVLEHELPGELWPLMNEILGRHVEVWVCDVTGGWHKVRGIGIRLGRDVVFSRTHFERAQELRLVVRDPDGRSFTNEFEVEHEQPLRPPWHSVRAWLAARRN